jgi:hypothetical protein
MLGIYIWEAAHILEPLIDEDYGTASALDRDRSTDG